MNKMNAWLQAFRLRTLPLAFSSIIMGNAIALSQAANAFNPLVLALSLITTLLLQILSNLANDYGDSQKGTDNDERIGPKRAIQSGLLSFREMKMGIIICSILALFTGIWLIVEATKGMNVEIGLLFFALGIGAIAAAIKYTVGKNAYGYVGLGDLFVVIFFGWVGVCGSYFLQAKQFSGLALLPATSIGLLAATVLHLNNMRDRQSDEKAGKITLAVRLGFEKSKKYFYLLNLVALLTWITYFIYAKFYWWQLIIASVPFIVLGFSCYKVFNIQTPVDFDRLLKVNAFSTFLLSVFFTISVYCH